jgi:SAM-dependent methyltransferase
VSGCGQVRPDFGYDGATWSAGPGGVYERLARVALEPLPDDLRGLTALDVGAGTGAVSRELMRRGAAICATDASTSMLRELVLLTDGTVPAFVADARALPLAGRRFDITTAGFLLNHLADPAPALVEFARVTCSGGTVLAVTFGADEHPVKPVVNALLAAHGFVAPSWYDDLKSRSSRTLSSASALRQLGEAAGLVGLEVAAFDVDFGDLPPSTIADYRLGQAHAAGFVAGMDDVTRSCVRDEVIAAIESLPPLRLEILALTGHPAD